MLTGQEPCATLPLLAVRDEPIPGCDPGAVGDGSPQRVADAGTLQRIDHCGDGVDEASEPLGHGGLPDET